MHLEVWRRLNPLFGYRDLEVIGTDLDVAKGTKAKCPSIKPSLTVANWGSSVSTST